MGGQIPVILAPDRPIMEANMAAALDAARVSLASLPIIDIGNLASPHLAARRAVAGQLYEACCYNGFFYVRNHGVGGTRRGGVQRGRADEFPMTGPASAGLFF